MSQSSSFPTHAFPAGRGKVLVVDDSAVMRKALVQVLCTEHEVLTAGNGKDALALAVSAQPDVILLDVIMPGMDGYAVCAHLKSDPRTEDIPVLFLTSLTGEEDETLALEAGAIDFVMKPFRPKVVAARIRNHVELKHLRDRIRQLAMVDGLTGVANRRRFDEALGEAWRRCAQGQEPLGLIMMDVDFFKRYNDHFGHQAGDSCLQKVAEVLAREAASGGALAARYGGEEFVCLVPGADQARVMALAESIRAHMQEERLPHPKSEVSEFVSLSLGVVSCRPVPEGKAEDLLLKGDERLYQAKQKGRNQVCG